MKTLIASLSEFKANAAGILEDLKSAKQVVVLTQRGAASAVIQDFDSYQRLQEALSMLKLMVQGEVDISSGRTTSQNEVFSAIKRQLATTHG